MSDEEGSTEESPREVGEPDPELPTLDAHGGTITPSVRTSELRRRLINVNLSQEQIARIASVEIARRDEKAAD